MVLQQFNFLYFLLLMVTQMVHQSAAITGAVLMSMVDICVLFLSSMSYPQSFTVSLLSLHYFHSVHQGVLNHLQDKGKHSSVRLEQLSGTSVHSPLNTTLVVLNTEAIITIPG